MTKHIGQINLRKDQCIHYVGYCPSRHVMLEHCTAQENVEQPLKISANINKMAGQLTHYACSRLSID